MSVREARVIRADTAGSPEGMSPEVPTRHEGARVVRAELVEAIDQARAILTEAQVQADLIRSQAQQEAERRAADALHRAREQAQQELAAQWTALRVREARADEASMDRTIALARLLAERVVHEQLRVSPESLVGMARAALAQFWRAEAITIRACARDLDVLRAHADGLGAGRALQLVCDDGCTPGSLRIRTAQGSLDAEVAVQLDRLVEALQRG